MKTLLPLFRKNSVIVIIIALTILVSCSGKKAGVDTDESLKAFEKSQSSKFKKLTPRARRLLENFDTEINAQEEVREADAFEIKIAEEEKLVQRAINGTLGEVLSLDPKKNAARIKELASDISEIGPKAYKAIDEMLEGKCPRNDRIILLMLLPPDNDVASQSLYRNAFAAKRSQERSVAIEKLRYAKNKRALERQALADLSSLESEVVPNDSGSEEENRRRRLAGIAMLGAVGGDESVDKLRDVIRLCPEEDMRRTAITAFGDIGSDEAVSELLEVLRSDVDLGSHAARMLGKQKREEIVVEMGEMLLDAATIPETLVAVVEGLGTDNGKLARQVLLKTLNDTRHTRKVHEKVIKALLVKPKTQFEDDFVGIVKLFETTPVDYLPQMMQPLIASGGDEALDLIFPIYDKLNQLKKIHYIRTLAKFRTEGSFNALLYRNGHEKDPALRRELIDAISRFSGEEFDERRAEVVGRAARGAGDKREKISAMRQLARISPEEASSIAEESLYVRESDRDVIIASIDILKKYGSSRHASVLLTLRSYQEKGDLNGRIDDALGAIDARGMKR